MADSSSAIYSTLCFQWVVAPAHSGERLDKFIHSQLPDHSRSAIQRAIEQGGVSCGGVTITSASAKVKPGQRIALQLPEVVPLALEPVPMALDIVYEDAALLVINKPAGLAVHPAPGTRAPTLVHGLLAHCADSLSGIGGVARPGIVHRIDKDTSGLLVVAKTDHAHRHLSRQLKSRTLSRVYTALCWGLPHPMTGSIEGNIGRSPHNRKRMAVLKAGGKEALTHYHVEEVFMVPLKRERIALACLLTCRLETGRTHQIRVHLNHIGHGLMSDPTYGATTENRLKKLGIFSQPAADDVQETQRCPLDIGRQALHAAHLTLIHPDLDEEMTFAAPLPDDMYQLISELRGLHNETKDPMI